MKRLYVNGKFFAQPVTGTQRYARELLAHLDILLSEPEYADLIITVLVPKTARNIPSYRHLVVMTTGRASGIVWEQLELPWYSRDCTLLTLSGGAPMFHSRNVCTIHDASVFAEPGGYSLLYRTWYQYLYKKLSQTALRILTVSHFSKSELIRWFGADPDRVAVTYLGSDHFAHIQSDASALRRFEVTGRYVLAVSSNKPTKNFARTIEALRNLGEAGIELVITGGVDNSVYGDSQALPDGARVLGYVSDPELKALYEGAACFVFASLYEGFGLPPLEAMSCGCPVVVSNTSSLAEIFREVATVCDPLSPNSIAMAVEQSLLHSFAQPQHLKEFAQRFSWRKCALETMQILDGID